LGGNRRNIKKRYAGGKIASVAGLVSKRQIADDARARKPLRRRAPKQETPMKSNAIRLLSAACLLLAAGAAHASSDDAWKAFAADVEAKCRKAAGEMIEKPRAVVDPFGSEHYGLALVTGKPKGARGRITHICVYDKQKKTVELGGELDAGALVAPRGK
jgi:hypothetical protein